MNTPVFSMERSLIKFKRQSLEKILIFSAKTNVFPPRGQDMSDTRGVAHYAHEKTWQNDSYDRVPARQRK